MPSELPFDNMRRLDAEFEESTLRLFVYALRSGKPLTDFSRMRRDLYKIAKNKGWSDKGAKAWASWTLEEIRRDAVARVEGEPDGAANQT